MHLGNEALTPECAAITFGAAGLGLLAAAFAARRQPREAGRATLAAGLGALVFAAQALNVPVLPGISGHLVGGALLAWTLGPAVGAWTMTAVLLLQALMLGDGGLTVLGANVLNMALLPSALVALARRTASANSGEWRTQAFAGLVAASSVPLAALLIVGETAAFRPATELVGWSDFAGRILAMHAWIGLAEGGLTLGAIVCLTRLEQASARSASLATLTAGALAVAMVPWSSTLPDGYEAAAEQAGWQRLLAEGGGWLANVQASIADFCLGVASEQIVIALATLLTAAAALIISFWAQSPGGVSRYSAAGHVQ